MSVTGVGGAGTGSGQPSGHGAAVVVTEGTLTEEGEDSPGRDPAHPEYVVGRGEGGRKETGKATEVFSDLAGVA